MIPEMTSIALVDLLALWERQGRIKGLSVRCLSPTTQVLCHAYGYQPTEKDFRDVELLQKRFGVAASAAATQLRT